MTAAVVGLTVAWVWPWLNLTLQRTDAATREAAKLRPRLTMNTMPNEWVVRLGRTMDQKLQENAVVFASGGAGNYVGTRRQYRLYATEAFEKRYGDRWREWGRQWPKWAPRMQEQRRQELEDFYAGLDAGDLQKQERALIQHYLGEGRQVGVLLPLGRGPRWAQDLGVEVELLAEVRQNERATWGLWAVVVR